MRFSLGILLLFTCVIGLPMDSVSACGSNSADHMAKSRQKSLKSCCSKDEAQIPFVTDSAHTDFSPGCPCDHENNGCHCPGCGMIGCSSAAFAGDIPPLSGVVAPLNASAQKMAFYFAGHLPEGVYLSIWQPPKIGA